MTFYLYRKRGVLRRHPDPRQKYVPTGVFSRQQSQRNSVLLHPQYGATGSVAHTDLEINISQQHDGRSYFEFELVRWHPSRSHSVYVVDRYGKVDTVLDERSIRAVIDSHLSV